MGERKHKIDAITVINMFLLMMFFLLWGCSLDQKDQNRLQFSSSPYLREHADNPVNWLEWGDEALNRAEKENKPLLISIGYSACHWCHVMEEESFMDTAVARVMNNNFICIKVDREEHPDIDKIYMEALQQLSGNAGWPLNAFALPDGKPFFAGTYYSQKDWLSLLQNITVTYRTKQKLVNMQAQALYNGMNRADLELTDSVSSHVAPIATDALVLYDSIIKTADTTNGGLKGMLKFPSPAYANMLLQHHYITGNKQALEIALHTLNSMALGGIYDQVGGGFARYATDSNWRIPHFEKMLYDNGLLVSVYAHAYQLTKNDWYKTIIHETTGFIERTLAAPGGGYFSSVNADTKDGEGKFYSWDTSDFLAATQQDSLLAEYFHITSPGNWKQEDNIPYVTKTVSDFALEKKIPPNQFNNRLLAAKKRLMEKRNMRTKPTIDTKIITAWNSIMIKGYADAYAATGTEEYLRKARYAAGFIEKQLLSEDGSLLRITSAGQVKVPGFLDDYAWTASALIRLYEVSFDIHWLNVAKKITDYTIKNFRHPGKDLFYYVSSAETKLRRTVAIADDDMPSAAAVLAEVCYRLGTIYQDTFYTNLSVGMCTNAMQRVKAMPRYHLQWCYLADMLSSRSYEIAIMGKKAEEKNKLLQQHYLPTSIVMGSVQEENLPLLRSKFVEGKTLIYVCTERVCKRPEEEPDSALNQIKKLTDATGILQR